MEFLISFASGQWCQLAVKNIAESECLRASAALQFLQGSHGRKRKAIDGGSKANWLRVQAWRAQPISPLHISSKRLLSLVNFLVHSHFVFPWTWLVLVCTLWHCQETGFDWWHFRGFALCLIVSQRRRGQIGNISPSLMSSVCLFFCGLLLRNWRVQKFEHLLTSEALEWWHFWFSCLSKHLEDSAFCWNCIPVTDHFRWFLLGDLTCPWWQRCFSWGFELC